MSVARDLLVQQGLLPPPGASAADLAAPQRQALPSGIPQERYGTTARRILIERGLLPPNPMPVYTFGGSLGEAIAKMLPDYQGTRYKWGGNDFGTGFDCSGFVCNVFGRAGFKLPRTAAEMYESLQKIGRDELEPGDLVFLKDTGGRKGISHVMIYMGNNRVAEMSAGKSQTVITSSLDSPYHKKHLAGFATIRGNPDAFKMTPEEHKKFLERVEKSYSAWKGKVEADKAMFPPVQGHFRTAPASQYRNYTGPKLSEKAQAEVAYWLRNRDPDWTVNDFVSHVVTAHPGWNVNAALHAYYTVSPKLADKYNASGSPLAKVMGNVRRQVREAAGATLLNPYMPEGGIAGGYTRPLKVQYPEHGARLEEARRVAQEIGQMAAARLPLVGSAVALGTAGPTALGVAARLAAPVLVPEAAGRAAEATGRAMAHAFLDNPVSKNPPKSLSHKAAQALDAGLMKMLWATSLLNGDVETAARAGKRYLEMQKPVGLAEMEKLPDGPLTKEGLKLLWSNKSDAVYLGIEQLVQQFPGLVRGIGTALGVYAMGLPTSLAVVGGGIAHGKASYAIDWSLELMGELQKRGVNIGDEKSLRAALINKDVYDAAVKSAKKHGLGVGIVDGLASMLTVGAGLGLAGKVAPKIATMGPVSRAAVAGAGGVAGAAIETGTEGLGEWAGLKLQGVDTSSPEARRDIQWEMLAAPLSGGITGSVATAGGLAVEAGRAAARHLLPHKGLIKTDTIIPELKTEPIRDRGVAVRWDNELVGYFAPDEDYTEAAKNSPAYNRAFMKRVLDAIPGLGGGKWTVLDAGPSHMTIQSPGRRVARIVVEDYDSLTKAALENPEAVINSLKSAGVVTDDMLAALSPAEIIEIAAKSAASYYEKATPTKPGTLHLNPNADIGQIAHELAHFADDVGLITPGERESILKYYEKTFRMPVDRNNQDAVEEAIGVVIQNHVAQRENIKGPVARIIDRIVSLVHSVLSPAYRDVARVVDEVIYGTRRMEQPARAGEKSTLRDYVQARQAERAFAEVEQQKQAAARAEESRYRQKLRSMQERQEAEARAAEEKAALRRERLEKAVHAGEEAREAARRREEGLRIAKAEAGRKWYERARQIQRQFDAIAEKYRQMPPKQARPAVAQAKGPSEYARMAEERIDAARRREHARLKRHYEKHLATLRAERDEKLKHLKGVPQTQGILDVTRRIKEDYERAEKLLGESYERVSQAINEYHHGQREQRVARAEAPIESLIGRLPVSLATDWRDLKDRVDELESRKTLKRSEARELQELRGRLKDVESRIRAAVATGEYTPPERAAKPQKPPVSVKKAVAKESPAAAEEVEAAGVAPSDIREEAPAEAGQVEEAAQTGAQAPEQEASDIARIMREAAAAKRYVYRTNRPYQDIEPELAKAVQAHDHTPGDQKAPHGYVATRTPLPGKVVRSLDLTPMKVTKTGEFEEATRITRLVHGTVRANMAAKAPLPELSQAHSIMVEVARMAESLPSLSESRKENIRATRDGLVYIADVTPDNAYAIFENISSITREICGMVLRSRSVSQDMKNRAAEILSNPDIILSDEGRAVLQQYADNAYNRTVRGWEALADRLSQSVKSVLGISMPPEARQHVQNRAADIRKAIDAALVDVQVLYQKSPADVPDRSGGTRKSVLQKAAIANELSRGYGGHVDQIILDGISEMSAYAALVASGGKERLRFSVHDIAPSEQHLFRSRPVNERVAGAMMARIGGFVQTAPGTSYHPVWRKYGRRAATLSGVFDMPVGDAIRYSPDSEWSVSRPASPASSESSEEFRRWYKGPADSVGRPLVFEKAEWDGDGDAYVIAGDSRGVPGDTVYVNAANPLDIPYSEHFWREPATLARHLASMLYGEDPQLARELESVAKRKPTMTAVYAAIRAAGYDALVAWGPERGAIHTDVLRNEEASGNDMFVIPLKSGMTRPARYESRNGKLFSVNVPSKLGSLPVEYKVPDMRQAIWSAVNARLSAEITFLSRFLDLPVGLEAYEDISGGRAKRRIRPHHISEVREAILMLMHGGSYKSGNPLYDLLDDNVPAEELWEKREKHVRQMLGAVEPGESLVIDEALVGTLYDFPAGAKPGTQIDRASALEQLEREKQFFLADVKRLRDVDNLWSQNAKSMYGLGLPLLTCAPAESCHACYAAVIGADPAKFAAQLRLWLQVELDPVGTAKRMAQDLSRLDASAVNKANARAAALPANTRAGAEELLEAGVVFGRLLDCGDLYTENTLKFFQALAEESNIPLQIFSRNHAALAKLKDGTRWSDTKPENLEGWVYDRKAGKWRKGSQIVRIASVDAGIYAQRGRDAIIANQTAHGLSNCWLMTDDSELPYILDLYLSGGLTSILPSSPALWGVFTLLAKDSSGKIFRHYASMHPDPGVREMLLDYLDRYGPDHTRQTMELMLNAVCPCDAKTRTFHQSCNMCAANSARCMNGFFDHHRNPHAIVLSALQHLPEAGSIFRSGKAPAAARDLRVYGLSYTSAGNNAEAFTPLLRAMSDEMRRNGDGMQAGDGYHLGTYYLGWKKVSDEKSIRELYDKYRLDRVAQRNGLQLPRNLTVTYKQPVIAGKAPDGSGAAMEARIIADHIASYGSDVGAKVVIQSPEKAISEMAARLEDLNAPVAGRAEEVKDAVEKLTGKRPKKADWKALATAMRAADAGATQEIDSLLAGVDTGKLSPSERDALRDRIGDILLGRTQGAVRFSVNAAADRFKGTMFDPSSKTYPYIGSVNISRLDIEHLAPDEASVAIVERILKQGAEKLAEKLKSVSRQELVLMDAELTAQGITPDMVRGLLADLVAGKGKGAVATPVYNTASRIMLMRMMRDALEQAGVWAHTKNPKDAKRAIKAEMLATAAVQYANGKARLAGQTLNSYRIVIADIERAIAKNDPYEFLTAFARRYPSLVYHSDFTELAQAIANNDQVAIADIIRKIWMRRYGGGDAIMAFMYNNALSGKAQVNNVVGNLTSFITRKILAETMAAFVSSLRNTKSYNVRATLPALTAMYIAHGISLKTLYDLPGAWRAARAVFSEGLDVGDSILWKQEVFYDFPDIKIGGKTIVHPFNVFRRAMGASDVFVRHIVIEATLRQMAWQKAFQASDYRQKVSSAKAPYEFEKLCEIADRYYEEILKDPDALREAYDLSDEILFTSEFPDWMAGLVNMINYQVFKPGEAPKVENKVGKAIVWALTGFRPIKALAFMFVRVSFNITRFSMHYTPLGAIPLAVGWKGMSAKEQDIRLGKLLTGMAILGGLVMLASLGLIELIGREPEDPSKRRLFYRLGYRPYTLRVGNYVMPLQNLGPGLSPWAYFLADYMDRKWGIEEKIVDGVAREESRLWHGLKGYAYGTTTASFMSAPNNALRALLEQDQYYFDRLLENIVVVSTLPFSSLMMSIAQFNDPYMRDIWRGHDDTSWTLLQRRYASKVPFLRTVLPPAYDPLGQPIEQYPRGVSALTSGFMYARKEADPVSLELERLEYFPQDPSPRFELGAHEEYLGRRRAQELTRRVGEERYRMLQELFSMERYKKMPLEAQRIAAQMVVAAAGDRVRYEVAREVYPGMIKKPPRPQSVRQVLSRAWLQYKLTERGYKRGLDMRNMPVKEP